MFESLSDRLGEIFKSLSGRGRLTKEEVELGMREVRLALLEADVNFKVARALVDRIRERAVGADVLESLDTRPADREDRQRGAGGAAGR